MFHIILLTAHIVSGSVAILSGFASISVRKGSSFHIKAGYAFYISMLIMASTAVYLAFLEPFPTNRIVGFLTLYLVITGRKTVLSRAGNTDKVDVLLMGFGFLVSALGIFYSVEIMNNHALNGTSASVLEYFLFFYTGIALLGGLLDLSMILRGNILGRKRIARHMWRMTFAHWIAVGSFFGGQQDVFPLFLQKQPMLIASPFILITLILLFWIGRVWFIKRFKLR